MTVFRLLAWLYAMIVFLAAACAWYVNIRLLNSVREHLLPDIVLMLVTLPASVSMGPLYENLLSFFSEPFVQLIWLTLCGAGQVCVLFFAAKLASRKKKHTIPNNSRQRTPDGAAEK